MWSVAIQEAVPGMTAVWGISLAYQASNFPGRGAVRMKYALAPTPAKLRGWVHLLSDRPRPSLQSLPRSPVVLLLSSIYTLHARCTIHHVSGVVSPTTFL